MTPSQTGGQDLRAVLAAMGVRPTEWWTRAILAAATGLSPRALSGALDRLVDHGLARMGPNRRYQLTSAGRHAADRARDDGNPRSLADLRREVAAGVTPRSVLDAALRQLGLPPE